MYSKTSGIYVMKDLPVDFLKLYYKLYYKTTTQTNCGNPSDTIVHFAIVYLSPQAYARKRESTENEFESQKKFLVFPR
jgi:hypothetical protein